VEPLAEALKDAEPSVQWDAAVALGRLNDARAVESLIAALKDSEVGFRAKLTEALAAIGPSAAEALVAALRNNDPGVRSGVTEALASIGRPAVDSLIAGFRDDDSEFRRAVREALLTIGPGATIPLIAALENPDWRIRHGASAALRKAKDSRAADAISARIKSVAPLAETYGGQIEKGESGTEDRLIDALSLLGNPRMAADFVHCGNPMLEAAGRRWSEDHGRPVPNLSEKRKGPRWGEQQTVL
jgi:HEAT repeat protein